MCIRDRLVDKLLALEKLYSMAGQSGEGAERFLRALEESGGDEGKTEREDL